jgi:RNA polymerase sigma factor (sigma-70 family)
VKRPADIDAALLRRARKGDMNAHAELYRILAPSVYTLAVRLVGARHVAEDVLQETFVEVIRRIDAYRGDGQIGAWIKRIAVTKCLMHMRSGWQARRVDGMNIEALPSEPPADPLDERAALEHALSALSDTARAVVWLHDVEGYTHEEIGRLMQRTASFSKSQLARAHERLRCSLEALDEPSEAPSCTPALKTC